MCLPRLPSTTSCWFVASGLDWPSADPFECQGQKSLWLQPAPGSGCRKCTTHFLNMYKTKLKALILTHCCGIFSLLASTRGMSRRICGLEKCMMYVYHLLWKREPHVHRTEPAALWFFLFLFRVSVGHFWKPHTFVSPRAAMANLGGPPLSVATMRLEKHVWLEARNIYMSYLCLARI